MGEITSVNGYAVSHGKNNGGGGGVTYIKGGSKGGSSSSFKSIDTNKLTANNANIVFLNAKNGTIQKLSGKQLDYDNGFIGNLATDSLSGKKIEAQELEAVKGMIETLTSKEITTEYLTVTKQAHFFELVIDKIRSVGGQLIITPASCVIDYVEAFDMNDNQVELDYQNVAYFKVWWRCTDENGKAVSNDFKANDQAICQSFNNVHEGVNYNVSNKYYWRLVNDVLDDKYINFTTGEKISVNNNNSIPSLVNRYKISLYPTSGNVGNNSITNKIAWTASAQTIQGVVTGVQWQDEASDTYVVNGLFSTSSKTFGIQIMPSESTKDAITSSLHFNIKEVAGENIYVKPSNLSIGVYFEDDTYMVFNDITVDNNYNVILDLGNPEKPIYAITIVSTENINWHMCHGIKLSNLDKDEELDGYSSIPSTGDNLVQLGYRGNDDNDRQSAIIISAYKSPDPGIHAPSYAQYMRIGSDRNHYWDLTKCRGSYIDARGAKFVGDITMCTLDGRSVKDAVNDATRTRLFTSANKLYIKKISNDQVNITPWPINFSVIYVDNEGNVSTSNVVPNGYSVFVALYRNGQATDIKVFKAKNSIVINNWEWVDDFNSSLWDATHIHVLLAKGSYNTINLYNNAKTHLVDQLFINFERTNITTTYAFRYKNSVYQPTRPVDETNGFDNDWSEIPTTPIGGEFTWMSQTKVESGDYGIWTTPIRITGPQGKAGEDGTDIEFVYTVNNRGAEGVAAPVLSGEVPEDGYFISNYVTWYDHPQGVSENNRYELISVRTKENQNTGWSPFTTPVVWSKWGEKGQDGDNLQYIFKVTDSTTPPADLSTIDTTTDQYQEKGQYEFTEFIPQGWYDEPQTIDANHRFEYVAYRRKSQGSNYEWGAYSTPKLWARYADVGETGGTCEIRYKNDNTSVSPPADGTDGLSDGWSRNPVSLTAAQLKQGYITWMTTCIRVETLYGEWTVPIRVSGVNGLDGEAFEYIYQLSKTTTNNDTLTPNDWETNYQYQTVGNQPSGSASEGEYIPTGWYDNPQSVSETWPYQFVSIRKKKDGVWQPFSTPVLWSKWSQVGTNGGHWEFRYQNATSAPTKPITGTDGIDDNNGINTGWAEAASTPTSQQLNQGYGTWMTQCFVSENQMFGEWTTPIRITGANGRDGEDGNEMEFVYSQQSNPNNVATPVLSGDVPEGHNFTSGGNVWWDNPQGVDSTHKYEFVSVRYRTNGTWGVFSTPVVWSKWGEKGQDGDGYEYIYITNNDRSNPPSNPTPVDYETNTQYQETGNQSSDSSSYGEYIPFGWFDEPQMMDGNTAKYQWVCVRKRKNGAWGAFVGPTLWSVWADGTPGAAGRDGVDGSGEKLMPKKEMLIVSIKSAISNDANCDLRCNLEYDFVEITNGQANIVQWYNAAQAGWYLVFEAYSKNQKIWTSSHVTDGILNAEMLIGDGYGTNNLMQVIHPRNPERWDYMNCYRYYDSQCPIYILVKLMKNDEVYEQRNVGVQLENGAILKVTEDAIQSAVSRSTANMGILLNDYSRITQTADLISTEVNKLLSNYSTTLEVRSMINQAASSIQAVVTGGLVTEQDYADDMSIIANELYEYDEHGNLISRLSKLEDLVSTGSITIDPTQIELAVTNVLGNTGILIDGVTQNIALTAATVNILGNNVDFNQADTFLVVGKNKDAGGAAAYPHAAIFPWYARFYGINNLSAAQQQAQNKHYIGLDQAYIGAGGSGGMMFLEDKHYGSMRQIMMEVDSPGNSYGARGANNRSSYIGIRDLRSDSRCGINIGITGGTTEMTDSSGYERYEVNNISNLPFLEMHQKDTAPFHIKLDRFGKVHMGFSSGITSGGLYIARLIWPEYSEVNTGEVYMHDDGTLKVRL